MSLLVVVRPPPPDDDPGGPHSKVDVLRRRRQRGPQQLQLPQDAGRREADRADRAGHPGRVTQSHQGHVVRVRLGRLPGRVLLHPSYPDLTGKIFLTLFSLVQPYFFSLAFWGLGMHSIAGSSAPTLPLLLLLGAQSLAVERSSSPSCTPTGSNSLESKQWAALSTCRALMSDPPHLYSTRGLSRGRRRPGGTCLAARLLLLGLMAIWEMLVGKM